jgi:hypothetical protein
MFGKDKGCNKSAAIFSIPIPIPIAIPRQICRGIGMGVGIAIGIDFLFLNPVQLESLVHCR